MMHKRHNENELVSLPSPSRLHATIPPILSASSPKMVMGRSSVFSRPATSLRHTPSSSNESTDAQSASESDILLTPSSRHHSYDNDDDQQNDRDDTISFSEENSPLKIKLIALLCALLLACKYPSMLRLH
jgi:hypothetical protein